MLSLLPKSTRTKNRFGKPSRDCALKQNTSASFLETGVRSVTSIKDFAVAVAIGLLAMSLAASAQNPAAPAATEPTDLITFLGTAAFVSLSRHFDQRQTHCRRSQHYGDIGTRFFREYLGILDRADWHDRNIDWRVPGDRPHCGFHKGNRWHYAHNWGRRLFLSRRHRGRLL